jgi:hypothetical protein
MGGQGGAGGDYDDEEFEDDLWAKKTRNVLRLSISIVIN